MSSWHNIVRSFDENNYADSAVWILNSYYKYYDFLVYLNICLPHSNPKITANKLNEITV